MKPSIEDINAQIADMFGDGWHVEIPQGYSPTGDPAWGLNLFSMDIQEKETVKEVAKAVLKLCPETSMVFYGQWAISRITLGL